MPAPPLTPKQSVCSTVTVVLLAFLETQRSVVWGKVNETQFVCMCMCVNMCTYPTLPHPSKSSGAMRPYCIKQYTLLLYITLWDVKMFCKFWLFEGFLESGFYLVCDLLCNFLKYGLLDLLPRCCSVSSEH